MIKHALLAAQSALGKLSELKYVAEDWGQIDYYDPPPVAWPCALIECERADYSDAGRGMQIGEGVVTVRVADLRLFNTSTKAPRAGEAYDIFDTLQKVYCALQGLSGETFTPLWRVSSVRARRDDAVREFRMSFRFSFNDIDAL